MDALELFDLVENDELLEGVGINDGMIVIKCPEANDLKTSIPMAALADVEWGTLRSVLVGEREPDILKHMSRVVGYFSNVANWNRSKIGELKDRQRGNYAVTS
jgi:hypothetical protein